MAYYKSGGINVTSNSNVSINTASGSIASFNTNLSMPVLETKATINPIQNGTPWIDSNVVNKEPYIKRAVAGTAARIGNHLYDKLVGGTVAFNQQIKNGDFSTNANWLITNGTLAIENNMAKVTPSYTSGGYTELTQTYIQTQALNGHKYYITAEIKSGAWADSGNAAIIRYGGYWAKILTQSQLSTNSWNTIALIHAQGQDTVTNELHIRKYYESSMAEFDARKVNVIDLTAMFGSTIADYIYSLERATAGAGVAWFKALFPNDYYAYNAGELMSVKATGHVMKNASNTVIGNYALDNNLELRGLFKLDANNKLYADGDTYESSGLVTRKLSSVTLDGNINPNNLGVIVLDNYTQVSYMPYINIGVGAHSPFLCDKHFIHAAKPSAEIKEGDIYNSGVASAPRMFLALPKTVTTAAEAVAWFANNPTTVLFYIATPMAESASPFTNPQVCDENGTEEYTDSRAVAIPVGHETYQANICEITGFDELNIQRCGANLYSNIFNEYRKPVNYYIKNIPLKNGITYTLKATLKGTAVTGVYVGIASIGEQYNEFQNMMPAIKTDGTAQTQTFIPTNTWVSPKLIIYVANEAQFNSLFENYDILLVEGRDTTYHPYTGNTYAIALGDTYYGGVLDVTRGKLRVTWIGDTINNMPFQYWAGGVVFYANLTDKKNGNTNVISDIFETLQNGGYGELSDGQIVGRSDGNTIYIKDTAYTDVSAFKSARGNGLIVYELATPFDIDLTPQQIEALLGVNNIWHDGNGNTEVKYRKVNIQ